MVKNGKFHFYYGAWSNIFPRDDDDPKAGSG